MNKPSLLIIEDNSTLTFSLFRKLAKLYTIDQAPTLQAAYALLSSTLYDVVLLDRSLPDGDGLEILSFLNKEFPQTKICVISHLCSLTDRLLGLEQGADYYLPKPFQPQEVLVLLKTLLRRGRRQDEKVLLLNEIELHLETHILKRGCQEIPLTQRETQLMELFLESPRTYVTREQIRNWFWECGIDPGSSYVHVCAQRLKRKLEAIRGTIVAHYGSGYELRILE